jgi:nucleolar GTP-binding protein
MRLFIKMAVFSAASRTAFFARGFSLPSRNRIPASLVSHSSSFIGISTPSSTATGSPNNTLRNIQGTPIPDVAALGRFSTISTSVYAKKSNQNSSASSTSGAGAATKQANADAKALKQKQKKKDNNNKNKRKVSDTGGLRRLPVVKSTTELINKARKVAFQTKPDTNLKNARNRARKEGAETMDAITKALCVPLRDVVNGYKYELRRLHPFEKVVADLTARSRQKRDGLVLQDVLDDIHEARKEVLIAGKDWTAKAKNADTAREAMDAMKEGEERMYVLFEELAGGPVKLIIELQKALRTTPVVMLDTPAVVLVGAPNVGKSSIVRAISSATPEVNNYPFTTRGMTLGHVQVFWKDDTTTAAAVIPELKDIKKGRFDEKTLLSGTYAFTQLCQVMDSPGLLVRPDNKRNEMEALTLAAMQHLPTAVMYVLDLSGGAGDKCSSVADQIQLRKEVRARFPRRPWIDVVAKYDLGLADGARDDLEEILDGSPYIELSIQDETGVDELRDEVMRMLGEVRVVLDAMAAVEAKKSRQQQQQQIQE